MGWPSATAPPRTFTFCGSRPHSVLQTIATTANPYACWDFWGYDSAAFDTKAAPQMAMTRAMIGAIAAASGED